MKYREFDKEMKRQGFFVVRNNGHMIYKNDAGKIITGLNIHNGDVNKFLAKKLLGEANNNN